MPRDDFSPEVKRRLAQRAGYLCSICDCTTVGPSSESGSAVNLTGEAAHIASASPGGRRYNASQTPAQRAAIENGIWLCSTHADLIDGDEVTYTVEELKRIKETHEGKVDLRHRGVQVENGLITQVELANFGEIGNAVNLQFTNRNLILGSNGVGKTLICEMIAALIDKKHLKRWHKYDWDKSNSYCCIHYFKNRLSKFSIAISAENEISYTFNDAEIPILIAPFKVFYLKEDIYNFRHRINREREEKAETILDDEDLLSWLSLYFGLSVQEFSNVINSLKREKKYFINDIRINVEEKDIEVRYWGGRNDDFHSFGEFSSGEKERIVLEIALRIANYYARFQTTVLLIENTSVGIIDQSGLNKLLDIVRQEELGFQFFFTSFQKPEYFQAKGYTIYELKRQGKNKNVDVT